MYNILFKRLHRRFRKIIHFVSNCFKSKKSFWSTQFNFFYFFFFWIHIFSDIIVDIIIHSQRLKKHISYSYCLIGIRILPQREVNSGSSLFTSYVKSVQNYVDSPIYSIFLGPHKRGVVMHFKMIIPSPSSFMLKTLSSIN